MPKMRLSESGKEAAKYDTKYKTAFWRGHLVGHAGGRKDECLYDGARNSGWRKAWLNGFDFGLREFNRKFK